MRRKCIVSFCPTFLAEKKNFCCCRRRRCCELFRLFGPSGPFVVYCFVIADLFRFILHFAFIVILLRLHILIHNSKQTQLIESIFEWSPASNRRERNEKMSKVTEKKTKITFRFHQCPWVRGGYSVIKMRGCMCDFVSRSENSNCRSRSKPRSKKP